MKLTHIETAETIDQKMTIWLDLEAEAEIDEYGNENIDKWLSDQKKEVAEFEKENPNLECISGDGNAVEYEGTAQDFINAGFDIEIEK